MGLNLKRERKIFKKVKPREEWVSSLRRDILGEEEPFFYKKINPGFSYLLLSSFLILFSLFFINEIDREREISYPEVRRGEEIISLLEEEEERRIAQIDISYGEEVKEEDILRNIDNFYNDLDKLEEELLRALGKN